MRAATEPKRQYRMAARADAAAVTRERILAAAWARFAAEIYERVRMADIASDARVSVQTLYSAFQTKDQLFIAGRCGREWYDSVLALRVRFFGDPLARRMRNACGIRRRQTERGDGFRRHGIDERRLRNDICLQIRFARIREILDHDTE